MELVRKNIHRNRIRCEAQSQLTVEGDMNIPDSRPDIDTLIFEKGTVLVDEVKPGTDSVTVRGRMVFAVLYTGEEPEGGLVRLEGKLPFEEKINMQGVVSADTVSAWGETEDLSVSVINSRKISIASVITLQVWEEDLYDEEVPVGIYGDETVQCRQIPVDLAQIMVCKNDIFRIREEMALPAGYPNVFQILWSSVTLSDVEFRPVAEKLKLQGDVHLFLLYEGEGEDRTVRSFEHTLPFSGALECARCSEMSIPDIRWKISPQEHGQTELSVRPDGDGEERTVCLDVSLDISVKLYEEEQVELITDIYGVREKVEVLSLSGKLQQLLGRVGGVTKVSKQARISGNAGEVLQLLYTEGQLTVEEQEMAENGILLTGSLLLQVLYVTGDDRRPYANAKVQIPWQYTLEVAGMDPLDTGRVFVRLEQLQTAMLDGEEMDVKAVLSFSTTVFKDLPMDIIREIKVEKSDRSALTDLPGMAIVMVRPGDTLWSIGKKYYVPVERIRTDNHLERDEPAVGQKLLIVKGA